jgi:hypothetical protein
MMLAWYMPITHTYKKCCSTEDLTVLSAFFARSMTSQREVPELIIILHEGYTKLWQITIIHLLFWIICRVCEYARVNPTTDAITAFDDNSMPICLKELIIQNNQPLSMKHLSMTMSHKNTVRSLPTYMFHCESFKAVWKLM